MAYPATLQYIKFNKDAPFNPAERSYALQLHGSATLQRVANLFDQLLFERVEGYHKTRSNWLESGRELLETELSSAVRDGLFTPEEQRCSLVRSRATFTATGTLALLTVTRSLVDIRRREQAMGRASTKDKAIFLAEEAAQLNPDRSH